MIQSLDDKSFRELIIDYTKGAEAKYEVKKNSIIEFYLTTCPHCQAMWPIVEEAAKEFPDVNFYKIEVSEHPELAALYKVQGTPTFILIPLKGHPRMSVGEMPLDEFTKIIRDTFK
ncbi:MAG: thioredoxin family protein [Bacteroidales bacterium]